MKNKLFKKTPEENLSENSILNKDWFSLLVLFIYWLLLFRNLITGTSWLYEDFPYFNYPGKFLAAVSLSNGVFPFWDPYSYGGIPFFADPQIALLYPTNYLLQYFVSNNSLNPLVLQISLLIHYLFIAVCCFYLGKEFKFKNISSVLFSMIFTFSSYMIIHAIHLNLIETVAWTPLIFLMFLKFNRTGKYFFIVIAGFAMALSIFAGYPPCFVYNFYFFGAFLLYLIFKSYKNKEIDNVKRLIIGLVIFVFISLGVSLVQTLETFRFSQNTLRIDPGYGFITQGSIHPYDLITMFIPKFFGVWNQDPKELTYWSLVKNGGHQDDISIYTISTLYLSILPLILVFPLIRNYFDDKKKNFPVLFLLISALIILLYAFGKNFFLQRILSSFMPFLGQFRNSGHITFLFAFCISLLSAYCLNNAILNKDFFKKYFSNKYFLILFSIFVFTFLSVQLGFVKDVFPLIRVEEIYNWIVKQTNIFFFLSIIYIVIFFLFFNDKINLNIFSFLLIAVLMIDLYIFGFEQNNGSTNPQSLYSQNISLINTLKEELKKESFRVNLRDDENMLLERYQGAFQRYQGAVNRIPFLEGLNNLILNRILPFNKLDSSSTQTLDLMNVKYKIKVGQNGKTMDLVPNSTYLPRAKMFYDIKVLSYRHDIREFMQGKDFNYNKTLVIEENPPIIDLPKLDSNSNIKSDVKITEYDLNEIKLEVETSENGFLFLSEIYYPAWKAYIDGNETEIFRTDYSLRSIYIPKGFHKIEFVYKSSSFEKGKYVSMATLFISIVLLGTFYKEFRKPVKQN